MLINGLIYSPLLSLFNDENSEIEDSIQWADKLYDELCDNHGTAVIRLEYHENVLKRVFYYIVNEELLCREETIGDKVNNNVLPKELLAEIVKNGYIIVKKY